MGLYAWLGNLMEDYLYAWLLVEYIFGIIYWCIFGWVLVRSNEVLSLGGITRKNVFGNIGLISGVF